MADVVTKLQATPHVRPPPPAEPAEPEPGAESDGGAAEAPAPDMTDVMADEDMRATLGATGIKVESTEETAAVRKKFKRFQTSCIQAAKKHRAA